MNLFGGNENHCKSGPITVFVVVRRESGEEAEAIVDLDEVYARTAEEGKRSDEEWFRDDIWGNEAEDCIWPNKDIPEAGRYMVKCFIQGWWSPSTPNGPAEYDEELIVESIDLLGIAALGFGEHRVECKIVDDAFTVDGHKVCEGVCRKGCASYWEFTHFPENKKKRWNQPHCKVMVRPIQGAGYPCIPWLRWSRFKFERMFEESDCPHSDQDPVEWIGFLKWAIEERDVEIEWLLDKLVEAEVGCGQHSEEKIRKQLIAEKHEMLKERVEQMKKEREGD